MSAIKQECIRFQHSESHYQSQNLYRKKSMLCNCHITGNETNREIYMRVCAWQNQQNDVRPAKTQISLGIRPVWSESSLSARRSLRPLAILRAHNKDSDQTGRIWVFTTCTSMISSVFDVYHNDPEYMYSDIQTGQQVVKTQIRLHFVQGLFCLHFWTHYWLV